MHLRLALSHFGFSKKDPNSKYRDTFVSHCIVENEFSVLGSKFERFNNNRSPVQTSDIKYYNTQFKTICLLKNIYQLVKDYNIEVLPHHKLWHSDSFEFPKLESKLAIAFNDEIKINKNYNEISNLQNKLLSMTVDDLDNDILFEEDIIMGESNEPKHKKAKKKNL